MNRAGQVIGPVAGLLVGVSGLLVVARTWLETLFAALGPARSADVALIAGMAACGASACVLGVFLAALATAARLQRGRDWPGYAQTARPDLPRGRQEGRHAVIRLPSGNWAGDPNIAQLGPPRDAIELAFADRPAVSVARAAFYDALRMPVLKRAGWRHDTNAYQAIRAYLRERGAVDEKGKWNDSRREAIRRMAQ